MQPWRFRYQSMGTQWAVSIWDPLDPVVRDAIQRDVVAQSRQFDGTFSRFQETSLVSRLSVQTGIVEVPAHMVSMLRLYQHLHNLSDGACNPLVGFTLSDLGYDSTYALRAKHTVRPVPDFHRALRIVDDTHIELRQPVLIDVGALGKGFFVDVLSQYLQRQGIRRFLVDGSGDVFYQGDGTPIRAGLEHPGDTSKVIGVVPLEHGSLCASSGNRRAWEDRHHIVDPRSLRSPNSILATWVLAPTAALADGLATCLFFTEPERFLAEFRFEYCILNHEYKVKRSPGFLAELF